MARSLWLRRSMVSTAAAATIVLGVASAAHAAVARDSHLGAVGSVGYSVSAGTSQGKVTDGTPAGYCAEFWWDWRTVPRNHHDAYAVRRCIGFTGQGAVHTIDDWRLASMRVAACRYRISTQTRSCSASWVYDSVQANTFSMEIV